MVTIVLAIVLAGAGPAPVTGVDDVRALVQAGLPVREIVDRIARSGSYIPLDAEAAVRLYFEGVPADVLAAVFATSGGGAPRVTGRAGEVELLYDGFRIVGRRGRVGPLLVVSGYASDGSRLKPGVVAPETPRFEAAARFAEPEPLPPIVLHEDYERVLPAVAPEPRREPLPWPQAPAPSTWGAPEFVSVTQVPADWIQGGSVVLPLGSTYGPAYLGYGSYYGMGCVGGPCPVGPGFVSYTFQPPGAGRASGSPGSSGRTRVVRDRISR